MLRLADYDIVFQEVPNETTLALNISECPHHCPGCHSPQLWESLGEELTLPVLDNLLATYPYVTCVAIMGGDKDLDSVLKFAQSIRLRKKKVAWYTGMAVLPVEWPIYSFDFIKIGPYIAELGGLKSPSTNQRFYRIEDGKMENCTSLFQRKLSEK